MAQWSNFASCLDLDLMIKSDFLLQILSLIPLQLKMSRVCWALNSGCVGSCWAFNSGCVGSCWALNSGGVSSCWALNWVWTVAGHWTREVWAVAGHWTGCGQLLGIELRCGQLSLLINFQGLHWRRWHVNSIIVIGGFLPLIMYASIANEGISFVLQRQERYCATTICEFSASLLFVRQSMIFTWRRFVPQIRAVPSIAWSRQVS